MRLGTLVEHVSPDSRRITAGGRAESYDMLLLATGASPRKITCGGSELEGVVTLRTLSDALYIHEICGRGHRAVAVGGGLLGVEIARAFRERGLEVEYLIRENRYWPGMMDETGSRIIENNLEENGLILRKEETVERILGEDGRVSGVRTESGMEIEADVVGIAIGVIPVIEFLEGSGIETDRGIVVGADLQSSAPGVFAAGDVAQAYDPLRGGHTINTSWKKALDQGKIAALNMTGRSEEYKGGIPSNTIRIYGMPVSCLGLANPDGPGYEFFTGPYPRGNVYKKLVSKEGKLAGAILIGDLDGVAMAEKLIRSEADLGEAKSALQSLGYDLAELLP